MIAPEAARKIRLLGLDVDGVLTDNALWLAPIDGDRVEFKRWDFQDGLGLVVLRHTPVEVAWISGRHSESTELRARDLKVATLIMDNSARKLPAVEALLQQKGLGWNEFAYVGDDLADLPVLRRAGIPIAVANACAEVKAAAAHVTALPGGHGAVREVVESLLKARGEWDSAVEAYLRERGETPA